LAVSDNLQPESTFFLWRDCLQAEHGPLLQFTILWPVNGLKISHVKSETEVALIPLINTEFGKDDCKELRRSRHETVFGCLKENFRHHDFDKHACCFRACAVLTQLAIEEGEPIFQVEYSDVNVPRIGM
jgi:hypothetical protein